MSERLQIIGSSNRSHTARLFAIWLFLIVMPALALVISFDNLLKDSEGYINDTLKIRMLQDLGDFRSKLSFARMVELKMRRLTSQTRLLDGDADSLARTINQQLQIPVTAVFHLNPQTGKVSSHVADSISASLGMLSRTMLQNYLTAVTRNNSAPSGSDNEKNSTAAMKYKRSLSYLRSLFSAAGEIEVEFNRATPSFSGIPALGRLLFYAVPLEKSGAALLVFRENDISLRQLTEFAVNDRLFTDLQRSITLSAEGRRAVYLLGNEMQHFSTAGDGALIVKGMASEEFMLRQINKGTLFPARLKETLDNPPLLQITAPLPSQKHPLRKVTAQAEKVTLLMVMIASVLLLRIFLFGYSSGLKIRNRILLCVLGASILPFSTFIASMAYHEHFVAEFEKSEILQYLNLQQDYLHKSLNARIDVEERKMAELAETLGRLGREEADKYLTAWKASSISALLLINSDDHEKIYTTRPGEALNATELSMKNLSFMTLRNALRPFEENSPVVKSEAATLGFKGLGILLENIGKLQETLSDNAVTLFSSFPIFATNRRFDEPTSLLLIKYYSSDLIHDFLKSHPEFTRSEIRGKYLIQSCFIPIKKALRLPPDHEVICSPGFVPARWSHLARHVMHSRSTSSWSDEKSTAVASFQNRLQCVIINTSQRISDEASVVGKLFLPALLYFLLMVAAMAIFMAKILIEPIDMLKRGAELIAGGDYQHRLAYHSGDEFEPLTNSFNAMTAGLYQRELLTSYVSQDVLSEVTSSTTLVPGGERVEASVVFCALKGFKEFSQSASPEQTVKVLGRLIEIADQVATRYAGSMDKLIEDTVMLVFRQGGNDNDHVLSACRAALAISQSLPDDAAPFNVAIGIASGTAVSGKIGSKTGKLDFTLIGNPVNLAARLKAQAHKATNTGIIACPATIRLLKGQGRLLFIERTEIKGRSRTFPLYELIELR